MMDYLTSLTGRVSPCAWGMPIIIDLVGTGIYLTLKLGSIQIKGFKHAIDLITGKYDREEDPGEVTHFQALGRLRSCRSPGKEAIMMRRMVAGMVAVFSAGLLIHGDALADVNMKEGLWEIRMEMEVQGIPMQMPVQIHKKCITKEDLVPQRTEPAHECRWIKKDIRGDTVTWRVICRTDEGPAEFNGRVTYKGETFEGVLKIKQSGMEMINKMRGRWLGECSP